MTIQRFSFMLNERTGNGYIGKDKEGQFITYEDHKKHIKDLENEILQLRLKFWDYESSL